MGDHPSPFARYRYQQCKLLLSLLWLIKMTLFQNPPQKWSRISKRWVQQQASNIKEWWKCSQSLQNVNSTFNIKILNRFKDLKPPPTTITICSRSHSVQCLAPPDSEHNDLRTSFFTRRRISTECDSRCHSHARGGVPEVLPAMAWQLGQVCMYAGGQYFKDDYVRSHTFPFYYKLCVNSGRFLLSHIHEVCCQTLTFTLPSHLNQPWTEWIIEVGESVITSTLTCTKRICKQVDSNGLTE